MDITITTPALLFPAISVLFLAYANRFLAIANRIRELHDRFNKTQSPVAKKQIKSLKQRIRLIITMQILAVTGIINCIFRLYFNQHIFSNRFDHPNRTHRQKWYSYS